MIEHANRVPRNTRLEADVCIVGSGAAGIPLALELGERGLSVVLIESGNHAVNKVTQSLYAGEVANALHSQPDKYRQRRFGGSTAIWGGRCMPFDPLDFATRAWIPGSGWPIDYTEIAHWYPQANIWTETGLCEYDGDTLFAPMFPGFRSERVRTDSLERFSCPTHFGRRYEKRLRIASTVQVLLEANCVGIEREYDRIVAAYIATLDGNRFAVSAGCYVLAAGGIETARLLLTSDIGNEHDQVGRYYMCHIAGNVGTLTVNGSLDRVRHRYEISPDGIYCRRRLSLTAAEQRRIGASNMVARLHFPRITDPAHKNGVLSGLYLVKNFISYEYGKRLHDGTANIGTYTRHLLNVLRDAPDTAAFLAHWLRQRTFAERKYPSVILNNRSNRFSLEIHGEQIPNRNSRITLMHDRDALGMRRVHIDWRYLPQDIDSVRKTLEVFQQEFARSGIATLDFDASTLEHDLTRFGAYGGHHIGTARMGDNPNSSVVDRNCRVHSTQNLYIAGSAVFPTSSQANPTLTIIALALRLADHLARSVHASGISAINLEGAAA